MNVLVVNAGSSSLKYQLFDTNTETVYAKGICERIGSEGSLIDHKQLIKGLKVEKQIPMKDHSEAMKIVVDALTDPEHGCISGMDEIEAVGHRVVHGGAFFSQSILLSDDVLAKLELCRDFAPLHTPAHIMGIKGCLEVMPDKPQVLVFDTAFHQTMKPEAYMYALPYEYYEKYGIRRYGAHGTSHRFVSGVMAELLGKPVEDTKIVTCHIGNGSSISAVKGGKVVDTSMGFTPLAGVEMGTRCGDIDPAIVPYMMEKDGLSTEEVNTVMNKKSGFLGISGFSSDSRDLEAAIANGPDDPHYERADLAVNILKHQIKKYIGAYAALMNGLDAVVFTAGIGENNPHLREIVCEDMEYFGIEINKELNAVTLRQPNIVKLSTDASKTAVYLIPTNEELVIARDTAAIASALKA
ncbi:MAG: acetate kinase [Ruminococcaceae bacterium]|nr:acetate kinase [Oscillospiraceae bacterium]